MANLNLSVTETEIKAIAALSNEERANLIYQIKNTDPRPYFERVEGKENQIICPICGSGSHGNKNTGVEVNFVNEVWLFHCFAKEDCNGTIIDIISQTNNLSTKGRDYFICLAIAAKFLNINISVAVADEITTTKKVAQTEKVEKPFDRLAESRNNLAEFVENQGGAWRGLYSPVLKRLNWGFLPDIYFPAAQKELPAIIIPNDKNGIFARAVNDKSYRNNTPTATTTIFLPQSNNFDLLIVEGAINGASILQAILFTNGGTDPNFGIIASGGTSGNKNVLDKLQELKDSGKNIRALIAYDYDSNNSGQNAAAKLLKMLNDAHFTACTVDITKTPDTDLNDVLNGENGAVILADMVNDAIANAIFGNPVTDNTPANTDNKFDSEIDYLKAELKAVEKQLADFDAEKKTNFECLKNLETFDRDTLFTDNVLTAAAFAKIFNRQVFSEIKNAIQRFKKLNSEKGVALPDFTAAVNDFEKSIRIRKGELDATRTKIKAKIQTLYFVADNDSLKNLNFPKDFTITEEGVGKIEGDHIKIFCRRPVYIKNNLHNLDETTIKQTLAFEDINHRQHILKPLPLNIIRNKNRLIEISEYNFPVDSGNTQELVDFLHCLQDENENNLETIFTINNCGWYEYHDEKYFVDPRRDIEIEHEGTKGKLTVDADKCSMAKNLVSKGSIDEWKRAYLLAKPSTIARATVAAAFAAPLLDLLGERNFCFYIYGKTRGGKSTAQNLAASAVGKPLDLVISFDGSTTALNAAAADTNHYPFFIDEKQSATPAMKQDFQRWLYNDANGGEKQRATKDGTARARRKWQHITICNGETQLSQDHWTGGAFTRLLQIAAPDTIIAPDTCKQIQDITAKNYGVAFNLFLDTILQTSPDEIKSRVENQSKEFQKIYPDTIPEHCRYIALLKIADYFLNKALDIENCSTLRTEELFDALPSKEEIDDATREQNAICGFIAEKSAHFEGSLKDGVDCYGASRPNEEYTFLTTKALKTICTESNFDYSKVVKDCVTSGFFIPSDKTTDVRLKTPPAFIQKKINGKKNTCFRIPNHFIFGDSE